MELRIFQASSDVAVQRYAAVVQFEREVYRAVLGELDCRDHVFQARGACADSQGLAQRSIQFDRGGGGGDGRGTQRDNAFGLIVGNVNMPSKRIAIGGGRDVEVCACY